jgi:hypothetical protein
MMLWVQIPLSVHGITSSHPDQKVTVTMRVREKRFKYSTFWLTIIIAAYNAAQGYVVSQPLNN